MGVYLTCHSSLQLHCAPLTQKSKVMQHLKEDRGVYSAVLPIGIVPSNCRGHKYMQTKNYKNLVL